MVYQTNLALGVVESVIDNQQVGADALTTALIKNDYSFEDVGRALALVSVVEMIASVNVDFCAELKVAQQIAAIRAKKEANQRKIIGVKIDLGD